MDQTAIFQGIIDLCCTFLGKPGGVPVTLEDYRHKIHLGKRGKTITKTDIEKLVHKLTRYNGVDQYPGFQCTDDEINVSWE